MKDCTLDYSKHCIVEFVTNADTHEDAPPINTMAERSQGAIYLSTTTNFQGSCKFIILRTGKIITRNQFTPLPITQYVMNQVEDMAIK